MNVFTAASVSRFFFLLAGLLTVVGLAVAIIGGALAGLLPVLAICPPLGFALCFFAVPALLLGGMVMETRAVFP